MQNIQLLNKVQHAGLRVQTEFLEGFGYDRPTVMIFPAEIELAHKEYVILFRKNEDTKQLIPNVLLGLEANENLMVVNGQWRVSYVPLAMRKGPLLLGPRGSGDKPEELVFFIDLADKRVNDNAGEPLFDDNGISPWLEGQREVLGAMHSGWLDIELMVNEFVELGLIESVALDIQLQNGEKLNLEGAFSISEERLMDLSGEQLGHLNSKGLLKLAFFISASLNNILKLIEKKDNSL